jgi:Zn-dependent protease with chaperone function
MLQNVADRLADQLGLTHIRVVVEPVGNPAAVCWSAADPECLAVHPTFLSMSTFPPEELERHAEVVIAHELGEIKLGHRGPAATQEEAWQREYDCDDVAADLLGEERVIKTHDRVLVRDPDPASHHPPAEERIRRLLWRAEANGVDLPRLRRTLSRFRDV